MIEGAVLVTLGSEKILDACRSTTDRGREIGGRKRTPRRWGCTSPDCDRALAGWRCAIGEARCGVVRREEWMTERDCSMSGERFSFRGRHFFAGEQRFRLRGTRTMVSETLVGLAEDAGRLAERVSQAAIAISRSVEGVSVQRSGVRRERLTPLGEGNARPGRGKSLQREQNSVRSRRELAGVEKNALPVEGTMPTARGTPPIQSQVSGASIVGSPPSASA